MFTEKVLKSEESSKFCDEVRTCLFLLTEVRLQLV